MFMLEVFELIKGGSWFIIGKYPCLIEIYCFRDEILIDTLFLQTNSG